MPRTYLSKEQHAKLQQNDIYRKMKARKGELDISGTDLANACGESRNTFWYRFKNQLLEPWELFICFEVLNLTFEVKEK